MKPKFSIGIPTLNRADLLIPALMYYKLDFPDIRVSVLDNGNQNLQEFFYKITTGFILSSGTNYPLIYNYKPQKKQGCCRLLEFPDKKYLHG